MECPSCQENLADDAAECTVCGTIIDHEPTVVFVPVSADAHPAMSAETAAHLPGVHGYGLVIERGPRAGLTFVLQPGVTTVGRDPTSDIFLNDITVSRQHCRFMVDARGLRIEDSGSTNGTYANEVRVDEAWLKAGDEVIIGKFHLLVATGDA
ncbi:MAG TPA: FHA domain-containing protein [Acidimicrobiia bacterium]|nr:FHA domain-containing protein [Acidimicrobiia bacterium]